MRTCPICGFHHLDTDARCIRCGAALGPDAGVETFLETARAPRRAPRLARLPANLFYRLRGRGARVLRAAVRPFRVELPEGVQQRVPLRAAFLGLIPGAGQLYNHQPKKAAFFVAGWAVMLSAAGLTLWQPWSNLVLVALVLWGVYAFHDGYKTARRINRDPWHLRLSLGFYLGWIFELCILALLAQYLLGFTAVKLRHMSESGLTPVIDRGDRFAVDILSYRFREPRVGDIVYYRPKELVIEAGTNMFIEKPLNGIERIVAGPGQTFARKGRNYYLDGRKVPASAGPLNQTEVPWNYQLQAPPGGYVVIRSYTSSDTLGASSPKLNEATAVQGWHDACLVARGDILGRVVLIYHPPPRRGWLTRGGAVANP